MSARRMDGQWRETEHERNARLKRKRIAASQKEAAPGGASCQSSEQHMPETTPKGEQPS
jgi:hypothetical protein